MGRLFFDLLVIFAVGKEAHGLLLEGRLPYQLALLALVVFPFLMGFTDDKARKIVIEPFSSLVRFAISLLSLLLFLAMDRFSAMPGMGSVVLMMVMPGYIFGRVFGGLGFGWFRILVVIVVVYFAYYTLTRQLGLLPVG